VLQLFVSVSLNALQQSCKRHLLFSTKSFLLLNQCFLSLSVNLGTLSYLSSITVLFKGFGFFQLFRRNQDVYLAFHVHQFFGELHLPSKFSPDLFLKLLNLEEMLLLELLQTEVGCGLIVRHVVIPSCREL
jgi:hypothetical protein